MTQEKPKSKRGRKPKNQNTTEVLNAPEVQDLLPSELSSQGDVSANADTPPTGEKSEADKAFDNPRHGHPYHEDEEGTLVDVIEVPEEKPADVSGAVSMTVDPATFLKISNAFAKPGPTKDPEPVFKAEVDIGNLPVEKAKEFVEVKKEEFKERDLVGEAEREAKRLAWYRGGPRV